MRRNRRPCMSYRLSKEIANLATEVRLRSVHDWETINELTLIVGYSYFVGSHPQFWQMLHKHLQAFMDLACTRGHRELCEHSLKILEIADDFDRRGVA